MIPRLGIKAIKQMKMQFSDMGMTVREKIGGELSALL